MVFCQYVIKEAQAAIDDVGPYLCSLLPLDVRRCVFMPIEELDQQMTYRRPVTDMYIPTIESDTLEKASHFYF